MATTTVQAPLPGTFYHRSAPDQPPFKAPGDAVAPGVIASPAGDAAMSAERIADLVPMKRAGRPEEVADLVGFLASDQAGYITGQAISINGGMA